MANQKYDVEKKGVRQFDSLSKKCRKILSGGKTYVLFWIYGGVIFTWFFIIVGPYPGKKWRTLKRSSISRRFLTIDCVSMLLMFYIYTVGHMNVFCTTLQTILPYAIRWVISREIRPLAALYPPHTKKSAL